VLTSLTAGSHALPLLSALPPKIDELIAASRVSPSTAAVWADIKAAGARKLAALQHGTQWASELQCTIVPQPGADPLASGQPPTLADFEMVREIQRGSHAAVWLVRKRQTRDEFAMKVIDKNRGRLHRLVTERKVLFSCQSPFVVTVFFAFEDADRLHLVMECLASDAKHLLQRRGVLEERQVISLMADTCLGLEHLHTCGIIHRDLKPENMLLTCEGRVKLADFGLSQLLQRGAIASEEELARDPSIVGTPFYMAPEVIRGKARGYEAAADWWSFGAITCEPPGRLPSARARGAPPTRPPPLAQVRAAHGLHALPGLKGGRDLPRDPVALFRLPAVALRHLGRGGRHGRPHAQPEPARAAHRRPHRDGAPLLCRRRLGGARCARRPAREPAAAGAEPADDAGARRDGAGAARLARRGGPAPFSRRLRGHPLGRGPIRRRPLDG